MHIASGDLWAGAEVQLYTLAKELFKHPNIDLIIVLLNDGELAHRLRKESIKTIIIDENRLTTLSILIKTIRLTKEFKPNIIHTHRQKENVIGSIATLFCNCKSVRTVHGAPEHKPSLSKPHKYLFYLLDIWSGRYLQQKIISVSDELLISLKKIFPKDKLCTIENGIDNASFKLSTRHTTKSFKVGIAGRLVPVKRIDIFIEIAQYLREHYPSYITNFHIYGEGSLLNQLSKLSTKIGVDDIVHFEGHCQDIHSEIASLDVLLICSDHEGVPMVLLEAMSLGTPVVAHAVGGIKTVCRNEQYGWLVEDNTVTSMAQTLANCLNNPTTRNSKAIAAQSHIRAHYSAKINAQSVIQVYSLLSSA